MVHGTHLVVPVMMLFGLLVMLLLIMMLLVVLHRLVLIMFLVVLWLVVIKMMVHKLNRLLVMLFRFMVFVLLVLMVLLMRGFFMVMLVFLVVLHFGLVVVMVVILGLMVGVHGRMILQVDGLHHVMLVMLGHGRIKLVWVELSLVVAHHDMGHRVVMVASLVLVVAARIKDYVAFAPFAAHNQLTLGHYYVIGAPTYGFRFARGLGLARQNRQAQTETQNEATHHGVIACA